MFKRILMAAGTTAIVGAALFLIPSVSNAQKHGGGGHAHGGSAGHGGGSHGSWGRGGVGFYIGGYPGWGYGYYPNYYYQPYYSYPGYYDYGYLPQYQDNYYNAPPASYGAQAPASEAAPSANSVILDMRVPDPDAQVWIEGQPTNQRGRFREFESPPLTPGQSYTYHVRAQWMQDGRQVDQTREVTVQPGSRANVDFSAAVQ